MSADFPFFFIYLTLSLLLSYQDIRYGLLPDRFTCPLLWSGLIWQLYAHPQQLSSAVWGAVAGYGGFAFIYWGYRLLRDREGLGYGDVKFLAALGAWHGWQSLPQLVLIAVVLASIVIVLRVFRRSKLRTLKNPLVFGPFLAAAGFVTFGLTLSECELTLL